MLSLDAGTLNIVTGATVPGIISQTAWRVFSPTAADVVDAVGLHAQAKIAFWDAMIVLAAAESGCDVLWTEDLSDDQLLRGVRLRNPFAADA